MVGRVGGGVGVVRCGAMQIVGCAGRHNLVWWQQGHGRMLSARELVFVEAWVLGNKISAIRSV